jgi:hypothetical protein
MGTTAVAVAIHAAERRLVRRLHAAGARSSTTAQPLPDLRFVESQRLQRLLDAGAIQEAAPGRYFVDDAAYAALRGDRRAVALAVLIVAAGAALLFTTFAARG